MRNNAITINNMNFYNLHIIDVAIILGYLAICLVIGFFTSKKIHTIKDYAIGSGRVTTAVLVGTFMATEIGAGTTVGTISKVQSAGLVFIVALVFWPLLWIASSYIFSKNIAYFKEKGCISLPDIMEQTYGKVGRWITNVVSFVFSIGIVALQIIAINYLLQYFLGMSSLYCSILAFIVVVTYSVMGGIRAVAITDLLQAIILFIAIPLACFIALDSLGMSFDELINKLPSTHKEFELSTANIVFILGTIIHGLFLGTEVPFIQRYLMANNESQLRYVMRECFYMSIPFTFVIIVTGTLLTIVPGADANKNISFYYLIDNYLPIGIKGLVITGMLAVIMSTADSWLNSASVMFAHDILGKVVPNMSKRKMLFLARATTIVIGFLSAALALQQYKGLMDFMWLIDNLWAPVMISPLIYAMFFKLSNKYAIIASSCMAALGVAIGWAFTGELAKVSTSMGIVLSALGLFGAHYWHKGISFKAPKFHLPVIGLRSILNFSENQVKTHGHNYLLAGALGVMYFISSIFLYNPHNTSGLLLAIRAISGLLSLGLLFHERIALTPLHQKYLALYYHIVLMIVFPVISGYMMLLTGFSAFWVISFLLAIIMMNFVCGITMTAILTSFGLWIAHVIWKKSGADVLTVPASMVHIGFTVILLVITARVRHNFQKSVIEMKDMYSTMLAHQVMQPIAQVSMVAEHAGNVLAPHINNEDLQEVSKQLDSLKRIGNKGTELVNGLLMMSRDDIAQAQDYGAYQIQDIIDTALLTYSEKQLLRIKLDKSSDFRFNGSKMFMVEVVRNIVNNSFKYAGPKAEIQIFCGPRSLHIMDNGRGIEKYRLRYIFDHTRNALGQSNGGGFGLSFVKRVLDSFSCSIICKSEFGEYTEFVIGFPRF